MWKIKFSGLLSIGILLTKMICLSKSDLTDIFEVCGNRDVIIISSNASDSLRFITLFPTSQIIRLEYDAGIGNKLRNVIRFNKFSETIVIFPNISKFRETFPEADKFQTHTSTRFLFLMENKSNVTAEFIIDLTKMYFPDLTEVYFGSYQNLYGVSCIKGVCISLRLEHYRRRPKSFLGAPLKMAMVQNWVNLVGTNRTNSIQLYESIQEINWDLLVGMKSLLNFSTEIFPTLEWAILHDNGSWAGMAKLVNSHEVDLALSRTYLLPYRVKHFRFLVVVYSERLNVFYHTPAKLSTDILADDCDSRIWLVVLSLICFIACLLRFILGVDIVQAFLLVIGTMSQQGPSHQSDVKLIYTSRMFSLMLNLTGLIFYTFFSALLVSTFSIEANIINALEDLFRRGYSFGILADSYLIKEDAVIATPANTTLGKIMASLDPKRKVSVLEEGTKAILHNEKFAFLSEINMYSLFPTIASTREICDGVKDLSIDEELIKSSAFVMKDSPYSEYLNYAYLAMWEKGTTPRFWKRDAFGALQLKPSCPKLSKAQPVVLHELMTGFLIPAVGIVSSLLIVGGEILFKKLWKVFLEFSCRRQSRGERMGRAEWSLLTTSILQPFKMASVEQKTRSFDNAIRNEL